MGVNAADVNVRHFRTFVYFYPGVKTSFKRENIFSRETAQTKLELTSKERAQAIP